ncbi:unnamed protein product [Effrenium voratum]|nr:unnamed protein product [Effrenium voratum]
MGERLSQLLDQNERLKGKNAALQRALINRRAQDKSYDASEKQSEGKVTEHKYQNMLNNVHSERMKLRLQQVMAARMSDELKNQLEAKRQKAIECRDSFQEFKRQIARHAEYETPEMSIFDTFDQITAGMQKREVPMMRVVHRGDNIVTLDNRRLAVYKMARRAGVCGKVKVTVVPLERAQKELASKSDSKVDGLSVKVRGIHVTVHADGSVTKKPSLSDGQLQHRADMGGHWTAEQHDIISRGITDIEAVVKNVLGGSAKLMKAGSFMKGTDIAGESDIDVMVFGSGPISDRQWDAIVAGIKQGGYTIDSVNPRCIHVKVHGGVDCLVTIEFDVVARQRQGYAPNKEPENPFRNNRMAAQAVRNIKMDFQESEEKGFSGNTIEQAVLGVQPKCAPGLGMLIDAAKAELKRQSLEARKRPRTAARENDASKGETDWNTCIGEGGFRKVFKGVYTVGPRAGQANVSKVFKDGTEAFEDSFFAHDVALCEKAIEIADAFNKVKKFKPMVQVCKASIWHQMKSKQRLLCEPFLSNFQSFNSNTGWQAEGEWPKALQSLSHLSYHHSNGDLVLCDLQGAIEDDCVVLTDPVINSRDKRHGPTDLGQQGIDNFFHHHTCSKWCDAGWSKPRATMKHFVPQAGTRMI